MSFLFRLCRLFPLRIDCRISYRLLHPFSGNGGSRTLLCADAAVRTLLIHDRKVIQHMDSIKGTIFLTDSASNTADGAGILHLLSLQEILAGNDVFFLIGH